MFDSLMAKTFTILGSQLLLTWIVAVGVIAHFRRRYRLSHGVSKKNGEVDVQLEWWMVSSYFYPLLIGDVAVFLLLLFWGTRDLVIGGPLFTVWSVITGVLMAICLVAVDENLGGRVLGITASITFITAMVGMYSGIDFSSMGKILFTALGLLLIANILRLFIEIPRMTQRATALFGVLVFTGYLLYDFNRLATLQHQNVANNWSVAMDLAISLYLDIINLFLELLDLLSK